jgi:hypothetical protein
VFGYGLDDRENQIRSPADAMNFSSSLCAQTGYGTQPASCTMGTGVLSTGVKRGRGVPLTTHPHLMPRSWMSRSYTSFPPCASIGVLWDCFTYMYLVITCLLARIRCVWHQQQICSEVTDTKEGLYGHPDKGTYACFQVLSLCTQQYNSRLVPVSLESVRFSLYTLLLLQYRLHRL